MHNGNGIKEIFFSYEGRLNRKRYILRTLALCGFGFALYVILGSLFFFLAASRPHAIQNEDELMAMIFGLSGLLFLLCLPLVASSYMLMIRRLHDVNMSGFVCLLNFVPFVNVGLAFYLLFKKGTEGGNEYGPDPLDMTDRGSAGDAPVQDDNPYARGAVSAEKNPYARTETAPKE